MRSIIYNDKWRHAMHTRSLRYSSWAWLRVIAATFILAACQNAPRIDKQPLSFSQYAPIHMAVSNIEVVNEYQSPMHLPYVEHLIPYSPAEAMEIWTRQRLRAVGLENTLQVIIKNGAVTVTQLPLKEGWREFFTGNPDKRYDGVLEVELRVYGSTGALSLANVTAKVSRSVIINEKASVQERDAIFRKMITDMMTMLNAQLEKTMFMYMSNYISFSHNP